MDGGSERLWGRWCWCLAETGVWGGLQMQLSHRGQGFSQCIQSCMCSEQGLPSSGWTVSARLYICLKAQAPQALGPVVLPDGSTLSVHVLPVTPSATALCLPPWPLC